MDARHTYNSQSAAISGSFDDQSFWRRVADSKYSPMRVLSDEEYEKVLKEKMVRVEAEIAIIDEDIERMQSQTSENGSNRSSR